MAKATTAKVVKKAVAPTVDSVLKGIKKSYGTVVPEEHMEAVRGYIGEFLPVMVESAKKEAFDMSLTEEDYVLSAFHNGIVDNGWYEGTTASEDDVTEAPAATDEVTDALESLEATTEASEEEEDDTEDDQPIIEVSQSEVKKALKHLLTKKNDVLSTLYAKHDEYNKEYFFNQLSVPLITIDKLSNKTLGNYTEGADRMAIENHIRFNHNFIALNSEKRILETLRHEMIHQWQDEVAYIKPGQKIIKDVRIYEHDEKTGEVTETFMKQKKRPKNWHNKDFRDYARVVGIPAIGAKCYGNPAKMPEPKSYNRKFSCACVASNGYPLTVWSTRPIYAVCTICKEPFEEVLKSGKVVAVKQSHVEKPGEDAIAKLMEAQGFNQFAKFKSKGEQSEFIGILGSSDRGETVEEVKGGNYQKGHNAYKDGYRYWVAWTALHVDTEDEELEQAKPVEKPVEQPAKPKKQPAKAKAAPKELPKEKEKPVKKKTAKIIQLPVQELPKERSIDNPQDIIDLYKELGTVKKVGEALGKAQSVVSDRIKKFGINLKEGTFDGEKVN